MVKLGYLFEGNKETNELLDLTKKDVAEGIDEALAKGSANPEVLKIMKELLDDIYTPSSMGDFMEYE